MTVYSERLKTQHAKQNPRGHTTPTPRYGIHIAPPVDDPVLQQMTAMSFADERLAGRLTQAAAVRVARLIDDHRLASDDRPTITVGQHDPPGDDQEMVSVHLDEIHAYSEQAQHDIYHLLAVQASATTIDETIALLNVFHLAAFRQGQAAFLTNLN